MFWSEGVFSAFFERLTSFVLLYGFLIISFGCIAVVVRNILMYLPAPLILIFELLGIDALSECLCNQFPWIGNYVRVLRENGKGKIARISVCIAMIALVFILTLLLLSFSIFSNMILYPESYPNNIHYYYFGSLILIDFLAFLHARCRLTLSVFPIFAFLSHFLLLYYLRFNVYPFHYLAIACVLTANCALIFGLIVFAERKLLYYDESYSYVPSLQKPRILFMSLFSTTWIEDTPPLWTIFMSNEGREAFSQEQMSLINHDFNTLRNHLRVPRNDNATN